LLVLKICVLLHYRNKLLTKTNTMDAKTTYPHQIKVSYFKEGQDWDDNPTLKAYFVEYTTVENRSDSSIFFQSLNHESNLKIEIL